VIWLQSPPWARWFLSLLIALAAIWVELRPASSVDHPFAAEDIAPGEMVDTTNTEIRSIPAGIFSPVQLGSTARAPIPAGDPILSSNIGDTDEAVPQGWWVIEVSLPRTAAAGDPARLVLLDSTEVADGVVVSPASDDPLGSGRGMVAVEPGLAPDVARAATEGRVAVMIGSR
jgi:hypothetical protein